MVSDLNLNVEVKPEIKDKPDSNSDSSLDQYFPKVNSPEAKSVDIKIDEPTQEVKTEESKGTIPTIFDRISIRNDNDITATPNISKVGLQTPIIERLNPSPLLHKESFPNLFQDETNLFLDPIDLEDSNNNLEVETKEFIEDSSNEKPVTKLLFDSIKALRRNFDTPEVTPEKPIIDLPKETILESNTENVIETKEKQTSTLANLFSSINSMRRNYDSPEQITTDLPKDTIKILPKDTILESNTENVVETPDIIDPWKEVKITIGKGNIHERFIDIDFGEMIVLNSLINLKEKLNIAIKHIK